MRSVGIKGDGVDDAFVCMVADAIKGEPKPSKSSLSKTVERYRRERAKCFAWLPMSDAVRRTKGKQVHCYTNWRLRRRQNRKVVFGLQFRAESVFCRRSARFIIIVSVGAPDFQPPRRRIRFAVCHLPTETICGFR